MIPAGKKCKKLIIPAGIIRGNTVFRGTVSCQDTYTLLKNVRQILFMDAKLPYSQFVNVQEAIFAILRLDLCINF